MVLAFGFAFGFVVGFGLVGGKGIGGVGSGLKILGMVVWKVFVGTF